jgi:hypothetical protein
LFFNYRIHITKWNQMSFCFCYCREICCQIRATTESVHTFLPL